MTKDEFVSRLMSNLNGEKDAEVQRLQQALFAIQCQQLDRGTNKTLTAKAHRELAMKTRDDIIAILATSAVTNGERQSDQ